MATPEQELLNRLRQGIGTPGGFATADEWRAARAILSEGAQRGNVAAQQALGATSVPGIPTTASPAPTGIAGSGTRTFGLGDLQDAIQRASQTGGPIPVPEARFQSPKQIMALVNQMMAHLQPLTEARTASAEADFNRQMQILQNRLAAQGALAGGGATAQQIAAVQDLGRFLDEIRAEQQAAAIPLALQSGQLGLQEAAQLFAMEEANRAFAAQQAQQYVQNILAGMSQEEAIRQFDESVRQFEAQMREMQRQFNIEAATQLTGMFGVPVQPAMTGRGLFGQLTGQMTLPYMQARAGITGVDPITGEPTFEAREAQAMRDLQERLARIAASGRGTGDDWAILQQAIDQINAGLFSDDPADWQRIFPLGLITGHWQTWDEFHAVRNQARQAKQEQLEEAQRRADLAVYEALGVPPPQAPSPFRDFFSALRGAATLPFIVQRGNIPGIAPTITPFIPTR